MLEKKLRKNYWRETKFLMLRTIVLPLLVVALLPLFTGWFGDRTLLGYPVSYVVLLHGTLVLIAILAARFVTRQDEIDHRHGAHEDL